MLVMGVLTVESKAKTEGMMDEEEGRKGGRLEEMGGGRNSNASSSISPEDT